MEIEPLIIDHGVLVGRTDDTKGHSIYWADDTIGTRAANYKTTGTLGAGVTTLTDDEPTNSDFLNIVNLAGAGATVTGHLRLGSAGNFVIASDDGIITLLPVAAGDVVLRTSGALRFFSDGQGNIGEAADFRPDNIYAKTSITSGAVFLAADGAAGAPSYSFTSDTDTGIWLGPGGLSLGFGNARIGAFAAGGLTMADGMDITLGTSGHVTSGSEGFIVGNTTILSTSIDLGSGDKHIAVDASGFFTLKHDTGLSALSLENQTDNIAMIVLPVGSTNINVVPQAEAPVWFYGSSTEGENQELRIYGHPTGEALKYGSLQIVDGGTDSYFQISSDAVRIIIDRPTTIDESLIVTGDLNVGAGGTVLDVDSALGTLGIGAAAVATAIVNISGTIVTADSFNALTGAVTIDPMAADKSFNALNFAVTLQDSTEDVAKYNAVSTMLNITSTYIDATVASVANYEASGTFLGTVKQGTKTITNYYLFKGNALSTKGAGVTLTNMYGLYLEDIVDGTNNWAIFSQGGNSSHAGNFRLGDNTAPTQPLDVKGKAAITAIGGYVIKLTNTTGAVTVQGQTVRADPTTNDAVILTAADDTECIGVFLEAGVADDAEAWVVVSGIADVAMGNNEATIAGNWVETNSAEAGYADATGLSPAASPQHFNEIGHCIETVAAGGVGTHILARCVLHFL